MKALALLFVLVSVSFAGQEPAQKSGGFPRPPASRGPKGRVPSPFTSFSAGLRERAQILVLESVRKELKLSNEQANTVDGLLSSWSKQESDAARKGDRVDSRRMTEETSKQIREILTDAQNTRLEQLLLQRKGLEAFVFVSPEVSKKLMIDAEQGERLRKVYEDWRSRYLLMPRPGSRSWDKLMDQFLAAFSESQRRQWQALLGEPFEFTTSGKGPRAIAISFPPLGPDARLLQNEAVRKDLALSLDQEKSIAKSMAAWEERNQSIQELLRTPGAADRDMLNKSMIGLSDLAVETTDATTEVLTAGQRSRLGQLNLQGQGLFAFSESSVAEELKLTRKQTAELLALISEWTRSVTEGSVKDREKLRQDLMSRALKILSDDQREQWETMIGRPFEFPRSGR